MKIINCDICKRTIGKTVDYGNFQTVFVSQYRPSSFMDNGITAELKNEADICNECSNEICDAQNRKVEEIINRINK